MKASVVRLFKDPDSSFIYHHETEDFDQYHHHPEYELVLIRKGRGIRLVGDSIDKFKENDLVFLGSLLPHVWRCNDEFFLTDGTFLGDGLVIQFTEDFLGKNFFELPENNGLKKFIDHSAQGCKLYGKAKKEIIHLMNEMEDMTSSHRLYTLFDIFEILSSTTEYDLISSLAFLEPYKAHDSEPLRAVIQYTLQNFKKDIKLKDVLEIANMSNTQFFVSFKRTYKMSFKNYLSKIRIGCACRLLTEEEMNISQAAYQSGFENISNFNRHFKQIKGVTPSEYLRALKVNI